jgi:hypothetical protein
MPAMPKGTTVMDLVHARHRRTRRARTAHARSRRRWPTGDEAALREYGELQAAFEAGGGYDRKHQVEKVLGGSASRSPTCRRTCRC